MTNEGSRPAAWVLRCGGMTLLALWFAFLSAFAPALAADPTGVLKVKSSVAGAEVYLDGTLLGTVPLTKYVSAGPHKVRVVADNFDPWVRQVTVEADHTTDLAATLLAGTGTIEFTGPKGAAIVIKGERYTLPNRLPSPGAGTLEYTAEAPGFESAAGSLAVVAGRNHLVDVVLESSANVLAIVSRPVGAKVFLDGKEVGVTPLRLAQVASGLHGVELRADGMATAYRSADNLDGSKVSLDITLSAKGAAVTIAGLGADSVVKINGVEVGKGATVKVDKVERGRPVVDVIEGETVITSKIDVPDSGAVSYRLTNGKLVEQKPLTSRWGFWAAVGGGAVAAGAGVAAIAVASEPPPLPTGDVVVELP